MGADGSDPRNLTAGTCISGSDPCSLSYDFQSTWAPDGRIVFWSDRTGGIALWSMAADGSDPQLIVDLGEASVGLPSVSPNGKRVTFISDDAVTDERSVHTVRMDGSGLRRLTWTDDLNPRFPID
jgi:Tol biopolymer transport system component